MTKAKRYLLSATIAAAAAVGGWISPWGPGPAEATAQGGCYDCYVIVNPLDCTDTCSHGPRCPCTCCPVG